MAEAIAAWNTRAAPALPPVPEIGALVLQAGEAKITQTELLANLKHYAELCGDTRKRNKFKHVTMAIILQVAHDHIQSQAAECARLRAMCDELAGAVEPFAAAAVIIEADRKIWIERPVNETGELEIEHFARARDVWDKYQQEQGL